MLRNVDHIYRYAGLRLARHADRLRREKWPAHGSFVTGQKALRLGLLGMHTLSGRYGTRCHPARPGAGPRRAGMRARRGSAAMAAALILATVAGHPDAAGAVAIAAGASLGSRDHASAGAGYGSRKHPAAGLIRQASGRDATQGGAQLASHSTVVNYPPSGHVRRLPRVQASAFVIADAHTGQVLAARDPHGWYRPASTLKVLTAISLIPALDPDATTVASHEAATTEPNDVGLKAGLRYK